MNNDPVETKKTETIETMIRRFMPYLAEERLEDNLAITWAQCFKQDDKELKVEVEIKFVELELAPSKQDDMKTGVPFSWGELTNGGISSVNIC